jgi:multiple sugar transport system substrate-binding protein
MTSRLVPALALGAATLVVAACGGGGGTDAKQAAQAKGPIKVWYSNNAEEVAWGKKMVAAWNQAHPNEKVTGQEVPTGKSSEDVIAAAITAGNAPCLVFNTSPAAVPQFQKQGGLVALDDMPGGKEYVEQRTGATAKQYQSPDGKYYQLPWKSNPVMIFYNKKLFKKAGIDANNPPLATYSQFLDTARKLVSSKAAPAAIYPAPTSEFYQSWFDYYPLFVAATGKQLVQDGKPQFDTPQGQQVADFWKTLYSEELAPNEKYNGDAFADQKAAMAIVGPWAVAVYGDKVDWGVAPVPTADGKPASDVHTFSDEKSIGMYSACKNRGTAWELLKFATSKEQDGEFLNTTGQMPMREDLAATYPDFFAQKKEYKTFADQAARTIEVPNVPNSVTIWQTFRDAYTKSVIFGKQPPAQALDQASGKVQELAQEGA